MTWNSSTWYEALFVITDLQTVKDMRSTFQTWWNMQDNYDWSTKRPAWLEVSGQAKR